MPPRHRSYLGLSTAGFHRLVYWEWGPETAERTVLCLHGLTRNGRDFDELAGAFALRGWRVVCPDAAGRGESEPLRNPADYNLTQYVADMVALIARLDVERLDWVGTSMGGLVGMLIAAQRGNPLRRLVLNDVGPFIPKAALERIASYLLAERSWPDLAAAERHFREIYATFGLREEAEWRRFTEISVRPGPGGGFLPNYDPGIAEAYRRPLEEVDLWPVWQAVEVPVLLLRGETSDLLLPETAQRMASRGPEVRLETLAGCGHAPALNSPEQIALVLDWLSASG